MSVHIYQNQDQDQDQNVPTFHELIDITNGIISKLSTSSSTLGFSDNSALETLSQFLGDLKQKETLSLKDSSDDAIAAFIDLKNLLILYESIVNVATKAKISLGIEYRIRKLTIALVRRYNCFLVYNKNINTNLRDIIYDTEARNFWHNFFDDKLYVQKDDFMKVFGLMGETALEIFGEYLAPSSSMVFAFDFNIVVSLFGRPFDNIWKNFQDILPWFRPYLPYKFADNSINGKRPGTFIIVLSRRIYAVIIKYVDFERIIRELVVEIKPNQNIYVNNEEITNATNVPDVIRKLRYLDFNHPPDLSEIDSKIMNVDVSSNAISQSKGFKAPSELYYQPSRNLFS